MHIKTFIVAIRRSKFSLLGIMILLLLGVNISLTAAQSVGQWSDPVNLSYSGSTSSPVMVVDSNGIFRVIWADAFAGTVYTSGDGELWNPRIPVALPFTDSVPALLADQTGIVHAFWRETLGGTDNQEGLYYSQVRAEDFASLGAWTSVQLLTDAVLDYDVALDDNGSIHLAYVRPVESTDAPAGIYYRKLSSAGSSWSSPKPLYQSPYYRSLGLEDSNVDLSTSTIDETTNVFAVWDNKSREKVFFAASPDGGITWGDPLEVDQAIEGSVNAGPSEILVDAVGNQILLLWQTDRSQSSCQQYYQVSQDGGNTWESRLQMFEGTVICPDQIQILHTENNRILLLNGIQIYLQAWDGTRWSDPQLQDQLMSFVDPETQNLVEFSCQQATIGRDEILNVIGCDNGTGQDIWFMKRSLTDVQDWFPQEAVWDPLTSVVISDRNITSLAFIADKQNQAHLFWSEAELNDPKGSGKTIHYSRWTAGQWSDPAQILISPNGMADQVAAAVNNSNQIYLTWIGGQNGQIFFSQADASQAVVADAWSEPIVLPSFRPVGSSPMILVDQSGKIIVTYAIPLNEQRGIYLTSSSDGGLTWTAPITIFDAVQANWEKVDHPELAQTDANTIHAIWTRSSIPGGTGTISLQYARSSDGGNTWSAPQPVVENPLNWSDIAGTGLQALQRVWQGSNGGNTTLYHEQSLDNGDSWSRTVPVSVFGNIVASPSLSTDQAGRLHLFLVVESGSAQQVMQHWLFDGEKWSTERNLSLPLTENSEFQDLTSAISPIGDLSIVLLENMEGQMNEPPQYQLLSSHRTIDIPTALVTPEPISTPLYVPTATPSEIVDIPTPTAVETQSIIATPANFPKEPSASRMQVILSVILPVGIGLLLVIGYLIYLRIVRGSS